MNFQKIKAEQVLKKIKIFFFTMIMFYFDLGIKEFKFLNINLDYIDCKYLFILIFPIYVFDFIKKKRLISRREIFFSFFITFIFLHYFFSSFYFNIFSFGEALKVLVILLYCLIFFFYRNFILKNLISIISWFLFSYFLLILIYYFKDLLFSYQACFFGCFSINREIFKEASHLAYIAPIIILYYLNNVKLSSLTVIKKLLLFFFIISLLFNLSTTLYANLLISSSVLLILFYKKIEKKRILIYTIIISFLLIPFDRSTLRKIDYIYPVSHYHDHVKKITKFNFKKYMKLTINGTHIDNPIIFEAHKKYPNLSLEVMFANFKLALFVLKTDPLGWGLNNYKYAHKKYISNVNDRKNIKGTNWLNFADGSNNFNKGIVEFGIFFFLIIFLIVRLLFDKHMNIQIKLLFFPILFAQIFIRGSGYMNGSFIVILILLIGYYMDKRYQDLNS